MLRRLVIAIALVKTQTFVYQLILILAQSISAVALMQVVRPLESAK